MASDAQLAAGSAFETETEDEFEVDGGYNPTPAPAAAATPQAGASSNLHDDEDEEDDDEFVVHSLEDVAPSEAQIQSFFASASESEREMRTSTRGRGARSSRGSRSVQRTEFAQLLRGGSNAAARRNSFKGNTRSGSRADGYQDVDSNAGDYSGIGQNLISPDSDSEDDRPYVPTVSQFFGGRELGQKCFVFGPSILPQISVVLFAFSLGLVMSACFGEHWSGVDVVQSNSDVAGSKQAFIQAGLTRLSAFTLPSGLGLTYLYETSPFLFDADAMASTGVAVSVFLAFSFVALSGSLLISILIWPLRTGKFAWPWIVVPGAVASICLLIAASLWAGIGHPSVNDAFAGQPAYLGWCVWVTVIAFICNTMGTIASAMSLVFVGLRR